MKINSQPLGTFSFSKDYDVVQVATLNKTDLTGGNNKFYLIESHISKDGKKFRLYSRYGRVGASGVEEERIPDQDRSSLDEAFQGLLREKTSPRKGYVEVKLAQTKMGSAVATQMILSDDVKKDKLKTDDSKSKKLDLHPTVETLIERIYSEAGQAVRRQLSGALQTSTENPLGTLTLGQINEGRRILLEIHQLIAQKPALKNSIDTKVLDLSNQFYSAIPQEMEKRPRPKDGETAMKEWLRKMALNNETVLDEKEDLLELLSDVQGMVGGFATDDLSTKYREVGCEYSFCDKKGDDFRKVDRYMQETRSTRHDWSVTVANVWQVGIRGQKDKHMPTMKDVGNIRPLFHGSRPANILGICKHGLLMRPPGAIVTGSMFGNGLYFADQSSKSEQYSMASWSGGSRGTTYFMFVSDVALGKVKQYQDAQSHLSKPPAGYDSVQGEKGRSLHHNEFIVYDIKQHILQYLVEFSTQQRSRY